jgi:phosphatidylinositol glycan class B
MLFFWFLPYAHGRFAAENWGGLLFFGGICLLLDARNAAGGVAAILNSALAGLLWGAAFFCRFQVGLAIAGAGLWLLLVDRAGLRILTALAVSFVLACALNVAIDRWLYGEWVCSPCNYFHTNIVLGRAAGFSTEPWWFYSAQLLGLLVPPFSLALVGLLAVSVWRCRSNILVWSVIPFVIGHNLLGHKEVRFLIPMTYALVPLMALGADGLPPAVRSTVVAWRNRRTVVVAAWVFVTLNSLALMVMTFKPSSETAVLYRRLYEESRRGSMVLYSSSPLPYTVGAAVNIYRPENLTLRRLDDVRELRAETDANPGRVFVFQQSLDPPAWIAANHLGCTPLVRTIPLWAARFNVNNWTSRMYRWSVFAIAREGADGC